MSAQMDAQSIIEQATARQTRAADVTGSTWVSASAGTGKTYVLTKRILGLFMSDHRLTPSQILAVTFTKAASREMENRIRSRLGDWATCSTEKLVYELTDILNRPPEERDIRRARSLFAFVLDEGININTIHGFCQQILARFPLEAGISPGFRLIEGAESAELLSSARAQVFNRASEGRSICPWAFSHYATVLSEKALHEALNAFVYNHRRFRRLFDRHGGLDGALKELANVLDVEVQLTPEALIKPIVYPAYVMEQCTHIKQALALGGASAQKHAAQLEFFLQTQDFRALEAVFITQKKTARKLHDQKVLKEVGDGILDAIEKLQDFCLFEMEKQAAKKAYVLSAAYLHLGDEILAAYSKLKKQHNVLDFDDLIHHSAVLLGNEMQSIWVRYRMDSGICHILLDEAQDTDRDQWQIVQSLIEEFYAGVGQHNDQNRTFFAVGDIKQSIYRFRGAEPHVFGDMRSFLQEQNEQAGHIVNIVELNASFRSTPAVLGFVDQVFSEENRHHAVDDLAENIQHNVAQAQAGGHVEVWSLIENEQEEDQEEPEIWPLPAQKEKVADAQSLLVDKVASEIDKLLNSGDVLSTTSQKISAGDVMILLRSRSLMPALIEALDKRGLPHTGADEVNLQEESCVEDVLAALKFFVSYEDDLSFAQLLKSPAFALSDDELYKIHTTRKSGSLWVAFHGMMLWKNEVSLLQSLMSDVAFMSPYEAIEQTLSRLDLRSKFVAAAGGFSDKSVNDALDALLEAALSWHRRHGGDLIGFLHDFSTSSQVLKRELEGAGSRIRLLTAHGSKGLEAPIVFMPDAHRNFYSNMKEDRPMWQTNAQGEDSLFLHRLPKAEAPKLQNTLEEQEKNRIFRDEMRLLYVALTRAKERLYVGGIKGKRGFKEEECWWGHIMQALIGDERWQTMEDGHKVWHLAPKTNVPEKKVAVQDVTVESVLPHWIGAQAQEESHIRIENASDAVKQSDAMEKLKLQSSQNLYKRGKIIHKLLEVLPTFEAEDRKNRAERYLMAAAGDFSPSQKEKMLSAALSVFETYPELFGENSRAEVDVSALEETGKRLEGVVDRLVLQENEVWVIDYKTNAQVPDEMPEAYRKQMAVYKKVISKAFPSKEVKCAILWTAANKPKLVWL